MDLEKKLRNDKPKRQRVSAYDKESLHGAAIMEQPAPSTISPLASKIQAPPAKNTEGIDPDLLAEFGDIVEFH